jgi:hypothetical protein
MSTHPSVPREVDGPEQEIRDATLILRVRQPKETTEVVRIECARKNLRRATIRAFAENFVPRQLRRKRCRTYKQRKDETATELAKLLPAEAIPSFNHRLQDLLGVPHSRTPLPSSSPSLQACLSSRSSPQRGVCMHASISRLHAEASPTI